MKTLIFAFVLLLMSQVAQAITVDRTDDPSPATIPNPCQDFVANDCSLRLAIRTANASPASVVDIRLPASSTPYIINRSGVDDNAIAGDLDILNNTGGSKTVGIFGEGADRTIIRRGTVRALTPGGLQVQGPTDGLFSISGVSVSFSGVSIEEGLNSNGNGGAISFDPVVTSLNAASNASLVLQACHIRGNTAVNGGGISAVRGGNVVVDNTTFSENVATNRAGAIDISFGNLFLTNTTISTNSSPNGGAIRGELSNITIKSSTITNNQNVGMSLIASATFSSTAHLKNTILLGNGTSAGNFFDCVNEGPAEFKSLGFNLLGTGCSSSSGTGDLIQTIGFQDLGPLQSNGGPTPTHAPLIGSKVIDGGDPNGCTRQDPVTGQELLLSVDQRGSSEFPRDLDGNLDGQRRCDIGAIEFIPEAVAEVSDRDDDGVADDADNCPDNSNADQANQDGDGLGDVCDAAPTVFNAAPTATDQAPAPTEPAAPPSADAGGTGGCHLIVR